MSRGRILIVDDEPDMRQMLRFHLLHEGFEVDEADGGQAGLDALEANRYALVLLDVHMRPMGGPEVLEAVRQRWPGQKVIMLSSAIDDPSAVQSWARNADACMQKPFDINLLNKVIANVIPGVGGGKP